MINKLYRYINKKFYNNDELIFCYQRTINYTYHSSIKISKVPSLEWYAKKRIQGEAFKLVLKSVLNGKYIPVVDADSEHDMIIASMWLEENNISHSIMASSNTNYWLILDRPNIHSRSVIEFAASVPGQDQRYGEFTNIHKMCYIRAEMKDEYFMPTIIKKSGSELIDRFSNKIINHFNSDLVNWLYRHESYKNGKIDMANPKAIKFDIIDKILE